MLVDVVLYSGERDMLLTREYILEPDITVVVESDHTFTNKRKGFRFQDKPVENMVYVPYFSNMFSNPWDNEFALRRAAHKAVKQLDLPDDANVAFFDVDEIPDPVTVRELSEVTAWRMKKYQMSAYWYQQDELTGFSGPWGLLKDTDVAVQRQQRGLLPSVDEGWHLSSFLSLEATLEKWLSFSHTELVRSDMPAWVKHCWREGLAIESGSPMIELVESDVPEPVLDGPWYWTRRRDS